MYIFFFQAEDGIRDIGVTGVQTCALPISLTGPDTVILSGISLGLESAVYADLLIGGAVYGAFLIGGGAGLYAVALAGCGLLTTAGDIVFMDNVGPVSDKAQGIAEMYGDI